LDRLIVTYALVRYCWHEEAEHLEDDYHNKFLPLASKVRKLFYNGWHPTTLADDTRELLGGGGGFGNPVEWLA